MDTAQLYVTLSARLLEQGRDHVSVATEVNQVRRDAIAMHETAHELPLALLGRLLGLGAVRDALTREPIGVLLQIAEDVLYGDLKRTRHVVYPVLFAHGSAR